MSDDKASVYDFNTALPKTRWQPEKLGTGDFAIAMQKDGYHPPEIVPNGKVVRFPIEGDKGGEKTGWYVYHDGEWPVGFYGDWRSEKTIAWSGFDEDDLSPLEKQRVAQIRQAALLEQAKAEAALHAECREKCLSMWASALPCANHPYLAKKQIAPGELRQYGSDLLVPVIGPDNRLCGLQRIGLDGAKKFETGTPKKGSFFRFPGNGKIGLCEGYATAETVHTATGWTVYAAFDAGNLIEVARWLKITMPEAEIVNCGDEDCWKERNAGRDKAALLERELGIKSVFPVFADTASKPTDWNDLACLEGLEAVRGQLQGGGKAQRKSALDAIIGGEQSGTATYASEAPPPLEWVFTDTVLRGTPFLVCGSGGTGKTSIGLMMAASLALNQPLLGPIFTPEKAGSSLVLLCEDPELPIRHRVWQLCQRFTPDERRRFIEKVHIWPCLGDDMRLVRDAPKDGIGRTAIYDKLLQACAAVPDLAAVFIDPLNLLHGADLERNEEAAQFFCSALADAGRQTGAAFFIIHHSVKNATGRGNAFDVAEALHSDAARGTGAIVNGMRGAANFVLLPPPIAKKMLGLALMPEEGKYLAGKISKNNYGKLSPVNYWQRDEHGLLDYVIARRQPNEEGNEALRQRICAELLDRAAQGRKLTRNTFITAYSKPWNVKKSDMLAAIEQCLLDGWLEEREERNEQNKPARFLYVLGQLEAVEKDECDFND